MVDDSLSLTSLSTSNFHRVKTVIVGDYAVGKTSVALRFTRDQFKDRYQSTVAASFFAHTVETSGHKVVFQIWDTAGQERYRSLIPMYLRGSEVAIMVYDITSMKSFENITFWMEYLREYAPTGMKFALIGNKLDLEENREVIKGVGERYAITNSVYFTEVSACTGENVGKIFRDMANTIIRDEKIMSFNRGTSIIIDSYDEKPQNKCRCK